MRQLNDVYVLSTSASGLAYTKDSDLGYDLLNTTIWLSLATTASRDMAGFGAFPKQNVGYSFFFRNFQICFE